MQTLPTGVQTARAVVSELHDVMSYTAPSFFRVCTKIRMFLRTKCKHKGHCLCAAWGHRDDCSACHARADCHIAPLCATLHYFSYV